MFEQFYSSINAKISHTEKTSSGDGWIDRGIVSFGCVKVVDCGILTNCEACVVVWNKRFFLYNDINNIIDSTFHSYGITKARHNKREYEEKRKYKRRYYCYLINMKMV